MKRSECTKESLCERGWKPCYSEESNHSIQYTFDEILEAIHSGAQVKKEVSIVTRTAFMNIGGRAMLCRKATTEEVAEQRAAEEQEHYEKAIKKIQSRNIARMRRK